MLGDMVVLCDIKVLEHLLHMNSSDLDCLCVFDKNVSNHILVFSGHIEISLSGLDSIINCNFIYLSHRILLDSVGGESTVDVGTEVFVVKHAIAVVSSSEGVEFFLGKMEVHHRKNAIKLMVCNLSLSKLVKIEEKFFDSYSLHNNACLKSSLNVIWISSSINSLLHESVCDKVEILSWLLVECATSISQLSVHNNWHWNSALSNISFEQILRLVNICAEIEVIDFSYVSFVEILSD